MSFFNNIRNGVGLFKMAFEKSELDAKRILHEIDKFNNSKKRQWMLEGIRYYDVDNDRLFKEDKFSREDKADNRLVHATYKNIVDEKVAYAFSKTPTLTSNDSEDETYANLVKETMGKYWDYEIESLAFEASNKGISWIHPYIDEEGNFKMFVPPSEQIIPIWEDSSHFRLTAVIRFYDYTVWRFGKEEIVTHVELWDKEGVRYFRKEAGGLLPIEKPEGNGHFTIDAQPATWGKVPFVPFKNNRRELPDLKFVKSLVDNYDLTRSEVANYIQEAKNFIMALKGYDGESLQALVDDIMRYRAIVLDEDGDLKALTPELNITAAKEHYEQLKKDILDSGQAVNRTLDRYGTAPSGIALRFLFSGLELKCNAIESEFRRGFDGLLYFVNKFLEVKDIKHSPVDLTILFNHDMTMDEEAIIRNADASRGIISDETIIANHPWVEDVETEMKRLEEQRSKEEITFTPAPEMEEDDGEENQS